LRKFVCIKLSLRKYVARNYVVRNYVVRNYAVRNYVLRKQFSGKLTNPNFFLKGTYSILIKKQKCKETFAYYWNFS
jgi:hypothetical protein